MIKGIAINEEFEIDNLVIKGSDYIKSVIASFKEPEIGPSEGDPDLALFNRVKDTFKDTELIEYIPMTIDKDVVY